jgi:endo-1,4-beta-xylanase
MPALGCCQRRYTVFSLDSITRNNCSSGLALNDDGSYRSNVFYDTIGEAYIPIAFAAAAAADPDAKLYYNDYSLEYDGDKTASVACNIVDLVRSYGAPIHGVGMQGHFEAGKLPSQDCIEKAMKTFTKMGLDVAITELDIRVSLPQTEQMVSQQTTDFETVTKACLNLERCIGITLWGMSDKYSWVPGTYSGYGAACPWNRKMAKKDAYWGLWTAMHDALC